MSGDQENPFFRVTLDRSTALHVPLFEKSDIRMQKDQVLAYLKVVSAIYTKYYALETLSETHNARVSAPIQL